MLNNTYNDKKKVLFEILFMQFFDWLMRP